MRIYIKDKPLRIKKPSGIKDQAEFDSIIDDEDLIINERKLKGNLLIRNANLSTIKSILFILHNKKLKNLESITVLTEDYDETVDYIKSKFKIIKAGGGVVFDSDPEAEFQETVNKSKALQTAAKIAGQYI